MKKRFIATQALKPDDKQLRAEAERRLAYLQEVTKQTARPGIKGTLMPSTETLKYKIGDKNPPSSLTIYRWRRAYSRSGNIPSLVPLTKNKGTSNSNKGDETKNGDKTSMSDVRSKKP
jgi:hypothetical protein